MSFHIANNNDKKKGGKNSKATAGAKGAAKTAKAANVPKKMVKTGGTRGS